MKTLRGTNLVSVLLILAIVQLEDESVALNMIGNEAGNTGKSDSIGGCMHGITADDDIIPASVPLYLSPFDDNILFFATF